MKGNWPFHDEPTGAKIYEAMFYGFGDSGFLAGSFEGYTTREAAIKEISEGAEDVSWIGTKPEQLGSEAITVLSGREYIDRLTVLTQDEPEGVLFYGKWSD
jgi:hypothetical protein